LNYDRTFIISRSCIVDETFFRSYYAAYNTASETALAPFLADDVVMVSAFGESKGKEAYLQTFRWMTSMFVDQLIPEKISISGAQAEIDVLDKLEARADVPDFLGQSYRKGARLEFRIRGTYQVKNGKIQHITIAPK